MRHSYTVEITTQLVSRSPVNDKAKKIAHLAIFYELPHK